MLTQVIGADRHGVAAGVAAAEPAFFHHRYIRYAVIVGQITRCRQPMSAAADNDDVILRFRLGATPRKLPILVIVQCVAQKTCD